MYKYKNIKIYKYKTYKYESYKYKKMHKMIQIMSFEYDITLFFQNITNYKCNKYKNILI